MMMEDTGAKHLEGWRAPTRPKHVSTSYDKTLVESWMCDLCKTQKAFGDWKRPTGSEAREPKPTLPPAQVAEERWARNTSIGRPFGHPVNA